METNYPFVPSFFEFSILSENQCFGSYYRRHNHWTSFGSSYCENSWRIWNRNCDSINRKPREHISRWKIQRTAQRPSRIRKKWILWRRKRNLEHQGNLCWPSQLSASKSIPERTKKHFYEWEKMEGLSCAFIRWRILGSCSIQDGYNHVACLWPRWKTNWWFKTLGYNQASIVESVCTRSTRFDERFWFHLFHEGSNRKRLEYCKDDHGSLCYWLVIQGHPNGIPKKSRIDGLHAYSVDRYTHLRVRTAHFASWAHHCALRGSRWRCVTCKKSAHSHGHPSGLALSVLNIPFVPFPAQHSSSSASLSRSTTTAPSYTRSR